MYRQRWVQTQEGYLKSLLIALPSSANAITLHASKEIL